MRVRRWKTSLRFVLVLLAVFSAVPALALHEESPSVVRLTTADNHAVSHGRSWGNWLAFSSTQDLAQVGLARAPGRQIFIFNMAYYDCFNGTTKVCAPGAPPGTCQNTPCPPPGTPYLRQVTNGPGDPDNPSMGIPPSDPTLPQDQWISFDALGVFNGSIGGIATHRQIYTMNLVTGEVRQVTASSTGDSVRPTVSDRGGMIAFESTASLDGFGNPAGVKQVYLYQRDVGVLRRLSIGRPPANTLGFGPSANATTNQTGTGVAFESSADLLGDGHDTGVTQIFYATFDKRLHIVSGLYQVTNGNADSRDPFPMTGGGASFIVFDSQATNLPGTTHLAGRQIYAVNLPDGNVPDPTNVVQRTRSDIFGDCYSPSVSPEGSRIAMICTGDPLLNGTTGNRAFVLDLGTAVLYQITGAGDVQPPLSQNIGHWFLALSTTSDLTGVGVCGYQIHIVDFAPTDPLIGWAAATALGQLPPDVIGQGTRSTIGLRTFELKPGTATGGSHVTVTTRDGVATANITGTGHIGLKIGAPDQFTEEAGITIQQARVTLPPMFVPGVGALCITSASDGIGTIDCDGGKVGGDLAVSQDHNTDDADFLCQNGCRESDPCPGLLGGPHLSDCPRCDPGLAMCNTGAQAGQVCDPDSSCPNNGICNDGICPIICTAGACAGGGTCNDPDDPCQVGLDCTNDKESTCNGRPVPAETGTYAAGGLRATIPVDVSLSLNPGHDDVYCTGDEGEVFSSLKDVPAVLRLTTGASTGLVSDADNVALASLTSTAAGVPFDCTRVRAGDLGGAHLVGSMTFLDVPSLPGIRDLLVSLDLEPVPGVLSSCAATCNVDTDCDDGDLCNGTETCVNGRCALGTPLACEDNTVCNGIATCDPLLGCQAATPPDCNDNNPCTTDSCDPVAGCQHIGNLTGPCDDANLCTTGDTCVGGACVGAPTACSDNNACNGLETCDPGTGLCQPGVALVCDDANPCTDDTCDGGTGCVHTNNTNPCDDQNACTENDVCGGGTCAGTLSSAAQACVAGNGTVCDGNEQCDTTTGACIADPAGPLNCNDNNPCTNDSCDPILGCQHVNNTGACDDGNACTTVDVCSGGACVGSAPLVCEDGDVCNGIMVCDTLLGCVLATPAPDCDDGESCTADSCDPLFGCQHVNLTGPCDDGSACTSGDTCVGGVCTGSLVVCDNGNACDGVETCDPAFGCEPGTPLVCNDNNPCTDDTCDGVTGCVFTNNDANPCSDGDLCTTADACVAGGCIGAPVTCSNNLACDGLETCDPTTGLCQPGTPLNCNDDNPCTDDSCDQTIGCVNAPNTNACDDGSACTTGDTCSGGTCVGTLLACDDNNACNGVETCDPAFGCQVGVTPNCDDGDACTTDSCDPVLGCVNSGLPNIAVCRLIALIDAITADDADLLGGVAPKKRLLRKANATLRVTQKFYAGNPRLQRNNQRRALRRLTALVNIIKTGLDRGTMDQATGDELIQLATAASLALQQAIP